MTGLLGRDQRGAGDPLAGGPASSRLAYALTQATEAVAALQARRQNLELANSRLSALEATVQETKRDLEWAGDDYDELGETLADVIQSIRIAEEERQNEEKQRASDPARTEVLASELGDYTLDQPRSDLEMEKKLPSEVFVAAENVNATSSHFTFATEELLEARDTALHERDVALAERSSLLAEASVLKDRNAALEREIQTLETAVAAMRASTSWKLTAPLRGLASAGRFLVKG